MHPTIAQQFAEHRQADMLRDAQLARLAAQLPRDPGFIARTLRQFATVTRDALHGPTTRHGVGPAIPAPRQGSAAAWVAPSPLAASAAERPTPAPARSSATRPRTARPSPSL